jgi:hypothetical protein
MELQGSLPRRKEHTTGPSLSHIKPVHTFFKINLISSHLLLRFSEWSISCRFSNQTFVCVWRYNSYTNASEMKVKSLCLHRKHVAEMGVTPFGPARRWAARFTLPYSMAGCGSERIRPVPAPISLLYRSQSPVVSPD